MQDHAARGVTRTRSAALPPWGGRARRAHGPAIRLAEVRSGGRARGRPRGRARRACVRRWRPWPGRGSTRRPWPVDAGSPGSRSGRSRDRPPGRRRTARRRTAVRARRAERPRSIRPCRPTQPRTPGHRRRRSWRRDPGWTRRSTRSPRPRRSATRPSRSRARCRRGIEARGGGRPSPWRVHRRDGRTTAGRGRPRAPRPPRGVEPGGIASWDRSEPFRRVRRPSGHGRKARWRPPNTRSSGREAGAGRGEGGRPGRFRA